MSTNGKRLMGVLVAITVSAVLAGCGPTPSKIEITPRDVTINELKDKPQLTTLVLDDQGTQITDAQVVWTSSDAAVVEVSASGELTAKASGKAEVTAAVGELKESVAVQVQIVSSLKPATTELSLITGEAKKVVAELLDEKGGPCKGEVEWTSGDSAVATVSADGTVTGVTPGTATLTVNAFGLSAEMKVAVAAPVAASLEAEKPTMELAAGATGTATVVAKNAAGETLAGAAVAWASADAAVATVTPDGQVTAVAAGKTQLTATSGAATATVELTVTK
jgi:uncharacterized protein YjdB